MTTSIAEYEERIVVFLDFLGFKSHIDRSADDPEHVARIARAFEVVREFTEPDDGLPNREVAQFSDCVVVSYRVEDSSSVFDLLLTVLLLQVELASRGFLVRGGITVGPLFHRTGTVFGPAMVKAYLLESKVAKHPRIIVDAKVIDVARDYPALHHSGHEEVRYVESFLGVDDEGQHYLKYVSWDAVVEGAGADSDDWPRYMQSLCEILREGLSSKDARVLEKMLWLHGEYRKAIEHFFDPPRPPEVIERHRAYYDALEDLPRLDVESSAASLLVELALKIPPPRQP